MPATVALVVTALPEAGRCIWRCGLEDRGLGDIRETVKRGDRKQDAAVREEPDMPHPEPQNQS